MLKFGGAEGIDDDMVEVFADMVEGFADMVEVFAEGLDEDLALLQALHLVYKF